MTYTFHPRDLESATKRARIPARAKCYRTRLQPGLHLGYRAGTGAWTVMGAAGNGREWEKGIGHADDIVDNVKRESNGVTVLTFLEARKKAEQVAGERNGVQIVAGAPKTIAEALDEYARDLGGKPGQLTTLRNRIPPALLAQTVGAVTSQALRSWRDAQTDVAPASVNRMMANFRAALTRAAKLDEKGAYLNRAAWEIGLERFKNSNRARHAILTQAQVNAVVAAAYAESEEFGLFVQLHAETGLRTSQLLRVQVQDLQGNLVNVPRSNKGKGKSGTIKVPLESGLVARLQAAAAGRALDAPLLTFQRAHDKLYRRVALAAGLPEGGEESTAYALRHSSIVNRINRGGNVAIIAKFHDTSVAQIESNYGRHIADHSEEHYRRTSVDTTPGANIVPLVKNA